MDQFDRAQELEQFHRRSALSAHQARQTSSVSQLVIDGDICCSDCRDPIEPDRLKARPDAAKCISCQQVEEAGNR